ncbi:AT-rich interactive domain-containing protein 4A isoform X2 [Vanacampus margaritifer]
MKAADEPAYLTVGTDVSAKYRGAFCEAKIKIVKRLVKVKVTLKGESSSQVVHDDQVKGPLRVGSTVEVKTNEGVCSEAVIGKLTDASLYTVVFDDGDEKTLRRSSLCLKGERHFAESETLDQLPLTNPEHFGTPVIGKKSNRRRRSSQAVADEENESSSSDEDEDDSRRLNDDLLGKVCSVKKEEQPASCFLALVVSPSCNDELVVKKDQCLVRSFSDSKFFTVSRRNVHPLNSISINKSELSNTRGFEAAQAFARRREVPEVWKMDMSQILDSSTSDDDDAGEEKESEDDDVDEEEKRKKLFKEPEEEPDPEERDHFLQQLYKFMEDRGTSINKPPVLGYKDLNLFKLFRLVFQHGGCRKIESGTEWKQIYMDLGIPILNSAASYNVKTAYKKYLFGFEEYCRSACITFRTIHHNNPRSPKAHTIPRSGRAEFSVATPKGEDKDVKSESESDQDEHKDKQTFPKGRRRCGPVAAKAEPPVKAGDDNGDEPKDTRRRSSRRLDGSDRGSGEDEDEDEEEVEEEEEEEEEEDDLDVDDDEDDEDEERERRLGARSEDELECDAVTGTKVRVKYGRGKTQKIYEAHIKKRDTDNGEHFYLVHYYGWNVRYDEWVKADRIIWPAEKGTRKRTRKKNKEEADKEEDKVPMVALMSTPPSPPKPAAAKRGRPQLRTTPTNAPPRRKTPSGEGRSNGKSVRMETPPNMANGDSGSRFRRTRRTSGMYDSDRASNEDSDNSTLESESEEPPDKKVSPWRGRPDKGGENACQVKEGVSSDAVAAVTAQPPVTPPRPSTPPQDAARVASPSEGEDGPAEEAVKVKVELTVEPEVVKVGPASSSPGRPTSQPDELQEAPSANLKTPPLSPPTLKVHNCETPPKMSSPPTAASPESPLHPPPSVLKRPDEPMVVLHCLPAPHLQPEAPAPIPAPIPSTTPSDTDSASEEEEEKPELKLRPERKQEEMTPTSPKSCASPTKVCAGMSPKSFPSPLRGAEAERRNHRAVRADQAQVDEESKERPEDELGTPPRAQEALGPVPSEEPQMGAEALLCHEVDLDDPDDKDKPNPSSEPLLIGRERPPSPHRPFLPDAVSSATPCPEELRPASVNPEMEAEVVVGDADKEAGDQSGPDLDVSQEARGHKRLLECQASPASKKHKRNHKRTSGTSKMDKNSTGHSSDSEDQSRLSSLSKSNKSRCPGAASPHAKEKHGATSPQRAYKWTFQLDALDSMSSSERISFLQDKLQEIRKYYMSLKSEVASIDRRRKRLKKKEREVSNTTASTSSGSSDTAMSPSSASPTQSTLAVECSEEV